jgi:hypothetical protein
MQKFVVDKYNRWIDIILKKQCWIDVEELGTFYTILHIYIYVGNLVRQVHWCVVWSSLLPLLGKILQRKCVLYQISFSTSFDK